MKMHFVKKAAAFLLACVLVSAVALGAAENLAGGWTENTGDLAIGRNPGAQSAFEKAAAKLDGYSYEPIALLSTQIVAGTNYRILCRGRAVTPAAVPEYIVVCVYENLAGDADITSVERILTGGALGGWTVNDGETDLAQNAEAQAAFSQVLEGLVGAKYEPVAYLGSQVVSGTNYMALYRVTPVVPDAIPHYVLLTVYANLEGQVSVLDDRSLSDVLEAAAETEEAPADAE